MATPVLSDSDTASGTGITITGSVDIAGSNRLAIVLVGIYNNNQNENVTGVTFGSDTCDKLGSIENQDDSRVEIWYKKNPTVNTGVTVTITFAFAPVLGASAWIGIFTGVDQSTTFGSYASGILDGADPAELVVTAVTGDYTVANICGEYGIAITITSGNQATELWTYDLASLHTAYARYTSTAGDFTYQWDGGVGQHRAFNGVAIKGVAVSYKLERYTKDKNDDVLGSCPCFLVKDNGDDTYSFIAYQLSNAVTGLVSFTGLGDNDPAYQIIAWKDDTPHVFDVTDHNLTPVIE